MGDSTEAPSVSQPHEKSTRAAPVLSQTPTGVSGRCEGLRVHTRPTLMSWVACESRVTFGCLSFPVRKAKDWAAGPARTFYTQVALHALGFAASRLVALASPQSPLQGRGGILICRIPENMNTGS